MKPKRFQDEKNLSKIRGSRCVVCGKPSDPCHIRSRGAGGGDEDWNLIALCRFHHTQQHALGWSTMCRSFPLVEWCLKRKGWMLEPKTRKLIRAPDDQ